MDLKLFLYNSIENKQTKKFKPIDIIHKPTKHPEIESICYYSNDIAKAYTTFYSVKKKNKRAFSCYECYYWRKKIFKTRKTEKGIWKIVQECPM